MRYQWVAAMLVAGTFLMLGNQSLAAASSVGDRVGEVLSTDIVAYVNGKVVPSMNIAGETAIAAEDLRESGFDVAWSPRSRTLRIEPTAAGEQAAEQAAPQRYADDLPIGTHLKDVLYTDIQAYYGDTPLRSFNIDGRTAIVLNDLNAFGSVVWDETERTIRFQSTPLAGQNSQEAWRAVGADLVLSTVKDVNLSLDFKEAGQFYNEEQVGFGEDGLPYMQLDFFSDQFGFTKTKEADSNRIRLSDGLYTFSIQPGNKQAVTYWGGKAVNTYELIDPPREKDGSIYLYSIDLEHLFGYVGKWNQDTRTLLIRYTSYDVKDYGLPAQERSDKLTVRAVVTGPAHDFSISDGIALKLDNDSIFGNLGTALPKTGATGESISWMEAPIRLHLGDNGISSEVVQGDRILYAAAYPVRTSYEAVPLPVGIPGFKLDQTETGYIKTNTRNLTFTGKADSNFAFSLSKFEEGRGFVSMTSPEMAGVKDGVFQLPLSLTQGNGLYLVNLYLPVATPRGPGYSNEGYFYIMTLQP